MSHLPQYAFNKRLSACHIGDFATDREQHRIIRFRLEDAKGLEEDFDSTNTLQVITVEHSMKHDDRVKLSALLDVIK